MAKESVLAGTTSHSVTIFIQDSSSTVGAGLSGLVFNTSGLVASYTFTGANATRVAITLATLAAVNSAFSSGGFKEIDATNMKGGYRLDVPNAALAAASGQTVTFELHGATNMAPCWFEIELTATNNQDGVRGGMTALPNAAAEAAGGLFTRGAGAGQIAQQANGQVDVNLSTVKAQAVTCAAGVTVGAFVGNAAAAIVVTAAGLVAITSNIKKNQALTNFEFLMTDSTNHNPATGKTVTCTRSIDGGAFGAGTLANVTEIGVGIYEVDFGAGDLNGKVITLRATATGCDDLFVTVITQA